MQLDFIGWSRKTKTHSHLVTPIKYDSKLRLIESGEPGDTVDWSSGYYTEGKVDKLELCGSFRVRVSFTKEELRNWLMSFARNSPKDALELFCQGQLEAINHLPTEESDTDDSE